MTSIPPVRPRPGLSARSVSARSPAATAPYAWVVTNGGPPFPTASPIAGEPDRRARLVWGVLAGILGQLLLLALAVLLSRGSGGGLLLWAGLAELAGLGGCVVTYRNARGGFSTGLRTGWTVAAAPCLGGVLVLAWYFGMVRVLGP
jgi:hypothetical protein